MRRHLLMLEPADGSAGTDFTPPNVADRTQGWLALDHMKYGSFRSARDSCVRHAYRKESFDEHRRKQVRNFGVGEPLRTGPLIQRSEAPAQNS